MRVWSALVPLSAAVIVGGLFVTNPSSLAFQQQIVEPWADRVQLEQKASTLGTIAELGKAVLPGMGAVLTAADAGGRARLIVWALDHTRRTDYLVFSIFDVCDGAGTGTRLYGLAGRFIEQAAPISCPTNP